MKKAINTLKRASILKNAKANGTSIERKEIMDIANLASKQKMKNKNKSSWTITEIIFMIARQLVVLKI